MRIVAIDPGPLKSGFLVWDKRVVECGTVPNEELRSRLLENNFGGAELCAIEGIQSFGMPVGAETFSTCIWIGRFWECARIPVRIVYRKEIKLHLCQTARAKDGNIRAALIEKHGAPGKKSSPGKTFGVSGHAWSALAIADYAADVLKNE